jgi:putative ABC transport system permease protein
MERLWQNLRYTIRVLGKNPGFTVVAILSLALGIGANTAIFTLINALLLRDLPVQHPEQLVRLSPIRQGDKITFSYPMFRETERGQRVFSALMAWSTNALTNVEVAGVLAQHRVLAVSGNAYSVLGTTPLLGRLLTPDDAILSAGANSQVAVIGYEFWQRQFGADPGIVGRQILIEGHPFTIVGVTRKWFTGLTTGEPPEITVPLPAIPLISSGGFNLESRSILWLYPIGRLKDGVTIEQARAQLQSFWPDVLLATASTETPGLRRQTFLSMGLDVSPATKGIAGGLNSQFERPLYVLAAIVGLILLVACVNLANLMLARAAARSHEMSVRVAIGASRGALLAQVLTESLALSFTGGLLGLVFAYWGSHALVLLMTEGSLASISLDLAPDLRVLTVTLSTAILTGILFGLLPAWRSSREDPALVLQQNARSLGGSSGKLGKSLIVTQVALSLILLLGAGLFVRSFERLRSVNLGFDHSRLLEITLNGRPGGYNNLDIHGYRKQLLQRIAGLPGVRSVGTADFSIPSPQIWHETVSRSSAEPNTGIHFLANGAMVSPHLFETLGIPLLAGRKFDETADQNQPRVAIVTKSLAERLFPDGEALGKSIRFGFLAEFQNIEIIGIAADARILSLRDAAPPIVYFSSEQGFQQWLNERGGVLFVRTNGAPQALAKTVSDEIESLGREYALETKTIQQTTSHILTEERVTALLSAFFAALALLLASIGLYGLMSHGVTRRTREIGIRVALGAQRENVLWIVLRETLALAVIGLAIGVPCALAACRLIASMLFGLTSSDIPTIVAVSILLLVVALFAGYLPARRASSIDPIDALRTE